MDVYRSAIARLEGEDPLAAVRHGVVLCRLDPTFGVTSGSKLVMRLRNHAERISSLETVPAAAIFARRTAAWAAADQVLGDRDRAKLWGQIGSLHLAVGERRLASEGFERLQAIIDRNRDEPWTSGWDWESMLACHLGVGRVGPAAAALDLMRADSGEAGASARWTARLELEIDKPLDAARSARRAIELGVPAYDELLDALERINQADRAAEMFTLWLGDDRGNTELANARFEALLAAGEAEAAEAAVSNLLDEALDATPCTDVLFSDEPRDAVETTALELAIERRTRLDDTIVGFEQLRDWAFRLGSTERLVSVLASGDQGRDCVAVPDDWRAKIEAPVEQRALGTRRAVAAIGLLRGRHDVAHAAISARLRDAAEAGAGFDSLHDVTAAWCDRLFEAKDPRSARRAMRFALPLLESAMTPADEVQRAFVASLKSDLVGAILLADEASNQPPERDRALTLLSEAAATAPYSWHVASGLMFAYERLNRPDEAIAAGEEFLELTGDKAFHDEYERGVTIDLVDLLHTRGERGDSSRAYELLETLLDAAPDDARILNLLAYWWAEPNGRLSRAERMARRAVEVQPENPHFLDTLAWVLFHRGDLAEAEQLLQTALRIIDASQSNASRKVLKTHYAEVLRRLGQAEAAEASVPR